MIIGINASAALKENPTGVEEYVFQMIKHLAMIPGSRAHRFVLYLDPKLKSERLKDLQMLPDNFQLKFLSFPYLWTQIRLAWEMRVAKIDVLLIPVHILPFIHPARSIVVLHGLEYEYFPELYPFWHRMYLKWSTKYALSRSSSIIVVSENTKKDLVKIYGANHNKIKVVHHGIKKPDVLSYEFHNYSGYILYIGRVELKKNILGMIEAYNILRQKNTAIANKLVLVGGKGFGFEKIEKAIESSPFKKDIYLKGYVAEDKKNDLWMKSSVFLFPSYYEGFGLPILEAQGAGIPVITSNTSCLPEVSGTGAVFVDPKNPREIAAALEKVLSDKILRGNLIKAGLENIKRFSWKKCAEETLKVLIT